MPATVLVPIATKIAAASDALAAVKKVASKVGETVKKGIESIAGGERFTDNVILRQKDKAEAIFKAAGLEIGKNGKKNYWQKYRLYAADIENVKHGETYHAEFKRLWNMVKEILTDNFPSEAATEFVATTPVYTPKQSSMNSLKNIVSKYAALRFNTKSGESNLFDKARKTVAKSKDLLGEANKAVTDANNVITNVQGAYDQISAGAKALMNTKDLTKDKTLVTTTSSGGGSMLWIVAGGLLLLMFGRKLFR